MTTGAEQTLTGMAADAARSTFEKSSGATERMAETATRTGEAAAGEVETRITEKTYGRMTRLERARQFLGGISKGTLDAEKVDRIAKLTRYQRAHDGGHSGS
jgi:DNA anti-recombination protein RmuC